MVRGADILRILLSSAMSITSSGSSPHKCSRELINFLQAGHDRPREFLSRLRYTSCAHLKVNIFVADINTEIRYSSYLACNMCAHGNASRESTSKPKDSLQTPQCKPSAASA